MRNSREHLYTYYLWEVISPGQEEYLGEVFLPVRHVETGDDIPQRKVEPEWRNTVVNTAKHRPDAGRDEEGGPGVQPVVKQLPQRPTRACPTRLFAVNAIWNGTNEFFMV